MNFISNGEIQALLGIAAAGLIIVVCGIRGWRAGFVAAAMLLVAYLDTAFQIGS